jgi:hypothetical protein
LLGMNGRWPKDRWGIILHCVKEIGCKGVYQIHWIRIGSSNLLLLTQQWTLNFHNSADHFLTSRVTINFSWTLYQEFKLGTFLLAGQGHHLFTHPLSSFCSLRFYLQWGGEWEPYWSVAEGDWMSLTGQKQYFCLKLPEVHFSREVIHNSPWDQNYLRCNGLVSKETLMNIEVLMLSGLELVQWSFRWNFTNMD